MTEPSLDLSSTAPVAAPAPAATEPAQSSVAGDDDRDAHPRTAGAGNGSP